MVSPSRTPSTSLHSQKVKIALDPLDAERTRKTANVRIHMERVIGIRGGNLQFYEAQYLDFLTCNQESQSPLIDGIVRVRSAPVNLCLPILPFN